MPGAPGSASSIRSASISPIRGTAIPSDHPLQKGDDVLGEQAEQGLTLGGCGLSWITDVAG